MTTYKVKVNPQMLIWAREDAGYEIEDLPKYLEKVSKWESGEDRPTWNELRKLSNKYKRPSVFFLRSKPPEDEEDDLTDYRTIHGDNFDESPESYKPSDRSLQSTNQLQEVDLPEKQMQ